MIVCPRTGRTWPPEYATSLKTCVLCGGKIDIRREAWQGSDREPMHYGGNCPPQTHVPADHAPAPQKPQVKLTGRELLERNEWYKRNIIDKEQQ